MDEQQLRSWPQLSHITHAPCAWYTGAPRSVLQVSFSGCSVNKIKMNKIIFSYAVNLTPAALLIIRTRGNKSVDQST